MYPDTLGDSRDPEDHATVGMTPHVLMGHTQIAEHTYRESLLGMDPIFVIQLYMFDLIKILL